MHIEEGEQVEQRRVSHAVAVAGPPCGKKGAKRGRRVCHLVGVDLVEPELALSGMPEPKKCGGGGHRAQQDERHRLPASIATAPTYSPRPMVLPVTFAHESRQTKRAGEPPARCETASCQPAPAPPLRRGRAAPQARHIATHRRERREVEGRVPAAGEARPHLGDLAPGEVVRDGAPRLGGKGRPVDPDKRIVRQRLDEDGPPSGPRDAPDLVEGVGQTRVHQHPAAVNGVHRIGAERQRFGGAPYHEKPCLSGSRAGPHDAAQGTKALARDVGRHNPRTFAQQAYCVDADSSTNLEHRPARHGTQRRHCVPLFRRVEKCQFPVEAEVPGIELRLEVRWIEVAVPVRLLGSVGTAHMLGDATFLSLRAGCTTPARREPLRSSLVEVI